MRFPLIDRQAELSRLRSTVARRQTTLQCVYGRRRVGKSRLLAEAFASLPLIYFLAAKRSAGPQREALAREIGRLVPGFQRVGYPSWEPLLERLVADVPNGTVVVLDEFPWMVGASKELPSLLQGIVDRTVDKAVHFVLSGSSQRMMMGFVLDAAEPLYGRASQILHLSPLPLTCAHEAFPGATPEQLVEHYAIWGGIPRYWEEVAEYPDQWQAAAELIFDPNGVFHREPERLLLDEFRQGQQADAILALVGRGCHRLSEIAGRLGRPATSISGPLARLVELGLLERQLPFGAAPHASKLAVYGIADPLLRFWYRFVDPNRSLLARGLLAEVMAAVAHDWAPFFDIAWEAIARDLVTTRSIADERFGPAARWWGRRQGGKNAEIDLVAASLDDSQRVLVGEVKLRCTAREADKLRAVLEQKARACPALAGKTIVPTVWTLHPTRGQGRPWLINARALLPPK